MCFYFEAQYLTSLRDSRESLFESRFKICMKSEESEFFLNYFFFFFLEQFDVLKSRVFVRVLPQLHTKNQLITLSIAQLSIQL